jgi:hypothetical protein
MDRSLLVMGITNPKNTQLKAAGLAVGAGILAAVATMFIPVSLIETITGSTGISEIIPATAAPLGDTARAVMAFLVGAVALVIVLIVSLRPETASLHKQALKEPVEEEDEIVDRFANLKARAAGLSIPKISLPKMPWVKSEDDILDLADLPKLRTFDAHPDAPARRPLSASSDLTEPLKDIIPSLPEIALPEDVETIPVTPAPIIAAPVAQPAEVTQPVAMEPIAAQAAADVPAEPTLSEMVAQLEAAVAQRKVQLAELEIVAANLTAGNPAHLESEEATQKLAEEAPSSQPEITEAQPHFDRPALEAVPASPRNPVDDDMDAALSAALETLQRMNVQAR